MQYDPNSKLIWMISGDALITTFNPATNAYRNAGSTSVGYHNVSLLDPDDKLFISLGADGIYYFDTSNPSATGITVVKPTTSGCAGALTGFGGNPQYPGVVWDPIDKVVVWYPNGGNVLYQLNPKTWTCAAVTYGATQGSDYPQNTPVTSGDMGTFGHFQYVPFYDIFVLCNNTNSDCWYLRPNR
jgi:hypothetical protein